TQAFPERGGNALLVIDPQQRFDPQVAVAQLRTDLADEPLDQCVLAPFRASGERGHGRTWFAAFTDALERLVVAVFQQRVVAGRLGRGIEQVAAEAADQPRAARERGKRARREAAL